MFGARKRPEFQLWGNPLGCQHPSHVSIYKFTNIMIYIYTHMIPSDVFFCPVFVCQFSFPKNISQPHPPSVQFCLEAARNWPLQASRRRCKNWRPWITWRPGPGIWWWVTLLVTHEMTGFFWERSWVNPILNLKPYLKRQKSSISKSI
jgi:hypothetical protein